MTESRLGEFQSAVDSWRRAVRLADDKVTIFVQAVRGIVGLIPDGLNRAAAVDEINDMALANDLEHLPQLHDVINEQLDRLDRSQVPDVRLPDGRAGTNGSTPGAHPPPLRLLNRADFIKGFVPPDYLVEGILQRGFVYSITGATGHAKSALALLLFQLVTTPGAQYLGPHRVEHGRAVYFVGENPADIRMRVIGANYEPAPGAALFIPGVFDITRMYETLRRELERIGPADLVVVDTSAAYFLGNEELSNTQMGAHARMLRRLTQLPGHPCVVVLCHPIKHAAEPAHLLPRGGGAFVAEVDGNLTAWRHDDVLIQLHHNKIRGPGFEPLTFRLETIRTDRLMDAKGRQLPTVRAVWCSEAEEDQQASTVLDDDDQVLAARLFFGDEQPPSVADLARHLGWTVGSGLPAKSRVHRGLARLEKAKPALVHSDGRGHWHLTEKGKEQARRVAIKIHQQEQAAKHQESMPF